MTDTPQTDDIELVNRFSGQLGKNLDLFKVKASRQLLRQLVFLSLLSTGTCLTPVAYESDDENAKPIIESTDSRINRTLDIIIDELDRLHATREHLDASLNNAPTSPTNSTSDMETGDEARFGRYRTLLDGAYKAVEQVLHEAMTSRDGFIAQDANEAIAGIVALRDSVDSFDDGYLSEEDMQ